MRITKLRFFCLNCESLLKHREFFSKPTNKEFIEQDGGTLTCPNCQKEYEIEYSNNFYEVKVKVENLERDKYSFQVQEYLEEYEEEKKMEFNNYAEIYKLHSESFEKTHTLITSDVAGQYVEIPQMNHSHIITILETYLADTFFFFLKNDKSILRKFVLNWKDFSAHKLTFQEIIKNEPIELIKERVIAHFDKTTFHNLTTASQLFEKSLGINILPTNENQKKEIFEIINDRHDCIHRNAKNKSDKPLPITKYTLINCLDIISCLVDNIHEMIINKEELKQYACFTK